MVNKILTVVVVLIACLLALLGVLDRQTSYEVGAIFLLLFVVFIDEYL